jgi:hypothetical protein
LSNKALSDDDRKLLIRDWLWEIEEELTEIRSSSLTPESKEKIKSLVNQIRDIIGVVEEKNKEQHTEESNC